MRIGLITNGTEVDLEFARENRIPCLEINIHQDLHAWETRKASYRTSLEKHGIEINAMGLWGRNYISHDEAERALCLDELKRVIDLCAFFGAKVMMTGGGDNPEQVTEFKASFACEILKPMVDYAESKGLQFAFYNCHWTNHITGPLAWDIVMEKLPTVGIKFDPSHPFYDDHDYLQHTRDYGHKFVHAHAKGGLKVGGKPCYDPPAGLDQIDWKSLFALLYMHNYTGDINLEPHSETWSGERYYRGILFSKRYLESLII